MESTLNSTHRLVWIALMAALVSSGAYLIIPVGPVPVSMQPFFVFLAGYVLGSVRGLAAMCLYLAAGAMGLPVFSGGGAGIGHLFGPTGGYLLGFIISPIFTGFASREGEPLRWISGLFWGIVGVTVLYGLGTVWLKYSLDIGWAKAVAVGIIPFAPWDQLKLVAAVACARYLQKYNLVPQ